MGFMQEYHKKNLIGMYKFIQKYDNDIGGNMKDIIDNLVVVD